MVSELTALGASKAYGQLASGASSNGLGGEALGQAAKSAATDFAQVFDKADTAVAELARGQGSAQAVVEAMAKAELALQTVVTVRDRVVEAYQEILRMPV